MNCEQCYDVVIIGGGINGAGILLDLSVRGFKTALFEKKDFSSGTTSKSTKLIHGGLRYLEYFEFSLVFESLQERELLLQNAAHLVSPLPLFLPTYKNDKNGFFLKEAGMILYDLLSFNKSMPHHSVFLKNYAKKQMKINKQNLQGASMYYDCQVTYPERLCLENILQAKKYGAEIFNYAEVIKIKKENITKPNDLVEIMVDEMFIAYVNNDILTNKINYSKEGPTILLFVGVNGVGKTTSIAKLAFKLKKEGKKVLLVAGDTFRAGATEQLETWGKRLGCDVVSNFNHDPSSVIYEGIEKAKDEKYDVVLIDTAGRLQNKVNLMNELEKVNRVIAKLIPEAPHETLLVIDATTGQNGLMQAKSFKEITNITGIVLTKLDGTAKGGIVIAIKNETAIPVKFVGLGEKQEDLISFDIEKYIYGLFKDVGEING